MKPIFKANGSSAHTEHHMIDSHEAEEVGKALHQLNLTLQTHYLPPIDTQKDLIPQIARILIYILDRI